ncbi:MAG: radical SAM protein [Candidatus Dadabacteria bacterium]|nr:radical SAM protein [Candidatus Dadabacteria bacterium]NIQ14372.1 radical SAM protein [Candidatus Dadabacteria bacterium]
MKVSEIFYSIQGEGVEVGYPTVFLRLFACDLRCSWCDTMYAVVGKDFKNLEIEDILNEIYNYNCKRVCITGGEPLIQKEDVEKITRILIEKGYTVILETSGHKSLPEVFSDEKCIVSMDCKCPSSGMEKRMDFSLYEKLLAKDQLKFVIKDKIDYEYAKNILKKYKIKASIIFQPVHGSDLPWLAESILKENISNVRVIPQIHKIIWGNRKGV